ncbi:hypothetical protein CES85_1704 [Ochrobactrum quorumnocens]|uniref:Uncharacterized protein n=1 Tax=Ochrobactrum quorumnocens TaxID=271865 RepID=A0A248UEX8_9HYPH|nr:hypothetical protein CES85_1704 [[Ochrobactrum] quorumnocens]
MGLIGNDGAKRNPTIALISKKMRAFTKILDHGSDLQPLERVALNPTHGARSGFFQLSHVRER